MVVSTSLMQIWSFNETGRPDIQLHEHNDGPRCLFIHRGGVQLLNRCASNVHRVQQLEREPCRWKFLSDSSPRINPVISPDLLEGHKKHTSWCATIARFENAVVTSTAVQIPFAKLDKITSTWDSVISISRTLSSPHVLGNSVTSIWLLSGRFVRIHSFGKDTCCCCFFAAARSLQFIVAMMLEVIREWDHQLYTNSFLFIHVTLIWIRWPDSHMMCVQSKPKRVNMICHARSHDKLLMGVALTLWFCFLNFMSWSFTMFTMECIAPHVPQLSRGPRTD